MELHTPEFKDLHFTVTLLLTDSPRKAYRTFMDVGECNGKQIKKLRGLSPRANYTNQANVACRRN
jgi:hypothetical protein